MSTRTLIAVIALFVLSLVVLGGMRLGVVKNRATPEPLTERALPENEPVASPTISVSPQADRPLEPVLVEEVPSAPSPDASEMVESAGPTPHSSERTGPLMEAPPSSAYSEVVASRFQGQQEQVSEEEIARAFELLGQMLGIPELTPEELKRKVEEVGGLRFLRDVPIDFMSREHLANYIRDLFDAEYPVDLAEREERMLRGFGFLTMEQDLRTIRERVLNENIAGFYDERPQVKKLFAISSGRTINLMNQLVLSHELRHAIQDQHLNLRRILGEGGDFDDRRLAVLSLIEGDATLLMEKFLAMGGEADGTGLGDMFGGLSGGMDARSLAQMFAGPELRGAPPVVQEQLIVPYLHGRALAAEIFSRGGFALLNQKLKRPPRSTEQVLHPEKYLDRVDEPMEVVLRSSAGYPTESEGRLGEVFIRILFEGILPTDRATQAAAGWGGDHYALWPDSDGQYQLLWRTLWDTDRDAAEFYDALASFASTRFGGGTSPSAGEGAVKLLGIDGSQTTVARKGREITLHRTGFE